MLGAGTHLGTYEIIGPLGAGGMGEVYCAKDVRLGRQIALKVLPEHLARDADHLLRFEREARTVAGLNHPNIVTLFSVEDEGDLRFLTMELVEGRSLADLVTPGGLPVARALEVATAIADALTAAHERGVVHRDLKPANVMVTNDWRVKVLDFGLARHVPPAGPADPHATTLAAARSDSGTVVGTAPYMAPEQIRAEPVDARADFFAFGVLLYEILVGRRPFVGPTAMVVGAAILDAQPEPLERVRPDLPAELARIVARCLEKSPEARFPTARELGSELRAVRQKLERVTEPPPAKVASIAVLPFVNRSRDEEDEYFSDGLADELMNVLTRIKGLRVAARASSFHFKGKHEDLATMGAKLNVATLLDGSVRKIGNRVRISVQLVNVADGYHLWSETYDRTLEDIFAVQDDIAQSVVKQLRASLLGAAGIPESGSLQARAEVAEAARGRGLDPEAHRLALQGRHMIERLTRDDLLRGTQYLNEALRLDPSNAMAWVDLARAHVNAAGFGWKQSIPEEVAAARRAADRALAIAPDLPEAHVVLGRIRLYFDWDWNGARDAYRRALELAPGVAVGRHGAGVLAQNEGRAEEALDLYRRAIAQDPLSAAAYNRYGTACLAADRFEEAEASFRKAIELAPQRILQHSNLALALRAQGRLEEALAAAERESEEMYRLRVLTAVHHSLGRRAESDSALRELVEKHSEASAYQIAEAYASRGEFDDAFAWLERARAQRDPGLVELNAAVLLNPLRADPRWAAFLKKMGLVV